MTSNKQNEAETSSINIEKKLSELLLKGWTMLADTCPSEQCRCPLMRNQEKKKYCCNCETWITNDGQPDKKAFNELFSPSSSSLSNKQEAQIKAQEIIEVPKKQNKQSQDLVFEDSVLQIHEKKLIYLSEKLSSETDLRTIKVILKDINLCIKNIKELNSLN